MINSSQNSNNLFNNQINNDSQILEFLCKSLTADRISTTERETLSKALLYRQADWQKIFCFASAHWLLPYLYHTFNNCNLLTCVPESVNQELHAVYKLNRDRNQRINSQLQDVIRTLNSADIQPLLLKGASYLLEPVSNIHQARMMSDIDILIKKKSINGAVIALKKNGYAFSNFRPEGTDYHLDPMIQENMPVRVELHTNPLSKAGCQLLSTDEAWNNTKLIDNETLIYYIFSPEYRLIHQFVHAEIHDRDYANMRLDLRQLFDFYLMCVEYDKNIDWKLVNTTFENTAYEQAWTNYVLITKSLFPNIKNPPLHATIEQHLYSRKLIAKLTGSDNKAFIYHCLERLARLPDRMASLSWYKTKLGSLFKTP